MLSIFYFQGLNKNKIRRKLLRLIGGVFFFRKKNRTAGTASGLGPRNCLWSFIIFQPQNGISLSEFSEPGRMNRTTCVREKEAVGESRFHGKFTFFLNFRNFRMVTEKFVLARISTEFESVQTRKQFLVNLDW